MRMKLFFLLVGVLFFFSSVPLVHAQNLNTQIFPGLGDDTEEATDSALATQAAEVEKQQLEVLKKQDVTIPEEEARKLEFEALFARRPIDHLTVTNFMEYGIQYAYNSGIPANTIMLILLLPLLASLYAFLRHFVGLPSIGMFLPIAFAITLVSTGITAGLILLGVIIFSSTFARIIFKKLRIMYLPKAALHMLVVSFFIVATLTVCASAGILSVRQLSIFPVLLLILLSEQIIAIQLERSMRETLYITAVTFFLGILGYIVLSSQAIRTTVLLYPETILLLIPFNIAVGRYFGLRLVEYLRFSPVRKKNAS